MRQKHIQVFSVWNISLHMPQTYFLWGNTSKWLKPPRLKATRSGCLALGFCFHRNTDAAGTPHLNLHPRGSIPQYRHLQLDFLACTFSISSFLCFKSATSKFKSALLPHNLPDRVRTTEETNTLERLLWKISIVMLNLLNTPLCVVSYET